jgi:hypothetical protein
VSLELRLYGVTGIAHWVEQPGLESTNGEVQRTMEMCFEDINWAGIHRFDSGSNRKAPPN